MHIMRYNTSLKIGAVRKHPYTQLMLKLMLTLTHHQKSPVPLFHLCKGFSRKGWKKPEVPQYCLNCQFILKDISKTDHPGNPNSQPLCQLQEMIARQN